MWSAWSEQAKTALERTGDAISKAATHAARASRQPPPSTTATSSSSTTTTTTTAGAQRETENNAASGATTTTATASTSTGQPIQDGNTTGLTQPELVVFRSIQAGWTNVVNQTKASIKTAQELAHEQQHRFLQHLHEQELQQRRRDPTIPLDVPALRDAEVVYVTDRLISMSHPNMASTTDGSITAERKLVAVEHLLHRRHAGRYMIWNVSEVEYDADLFHNQVLTFHFPGSPSPPLGLLLKLLISMEAWLKADDRNVAVVHCLTGKGRTSTVLAAFLCWMGQAGFGNMVAALQYMAACKKTTLDDLVIPSQRRYATYFSNMLDGVRPSQPPLVLQRIILSTAPRFAKGPPREYVNNNNSSSAKDGVISTTATSTDESQLWGCCPYMQLFKAGHLLYTAPAVRNTQQQQQQPQPTSGATATATTAINTASSSDELVFCQVADGSIRFEINQVVQGDILIRCRHIKLIAGSRKPVRVSMFRAAFHTGYVPPTVMRLTKQQLDGACHDDRFLDDFYIDLIFGPADAGHVSAILRQQDQEQQHQQQVSSTDADTTTVSAIDGQQDSTEQPIATEISDATTPPMESPSNSNESNNKNSSNMVVSASSDDSMLHRDSRFWDVIQVRRHEKAAAAQAHQDTISSSNAISAEEVVSFNQQQQQHHHHHHHAAMMGDDMWGPTVGRRRTFEKNRHQQAGKTDGTVNKSDEMPMSASTSSSASSSKPSALETFSIGHELDFLPTVNEITTPPPAAAAAVPKSAATVKSSTTTTTAKPHDSLMEALMGALDDDDDHDTEEVIFFEGKDEEADPPANNNNNTNNNSSMNFRPTIVALPPLPVTATTVTTISTSNEAGASNDSGTNNKEIAVPAVAATASEMIDVRSLMPHTNKDIGRTVTDSAVGETLSVLDSDPIRSSDPSAEEILAAANMNLDDDVNAFLGTSNNNNDDDDDDDDGALVNLDDDDDDLQDLENMLSSVK